MDVIFATIELNEDGKYISRRDLINDGFDCEIFVNQVKVVDNIKLKKDNNIVYTFKNKYNDLKNMFEECKLLSTVNLNNFDSSNVTNLEGMFRNCSSLKIIDLDNFNTNNVTNISCMFDGCKSLKSIDLSNFNTKNIIEMILVF